MDSSFVRRSALRLKKRQRIKEFKVVIRSQAGPQYAVRSTPRCMHPPLGGPTRWNGRAYVTAGCMHAMDGTVWTRRLHEKTLERRVHPFIHSLRNRCITKLRRSIMNSIMPAANRKIETADGWLLRALNSTGWYAVAGGCGCMRG